MHLSELTALATRDRAGKRRAALGLPRDQSERTTSAGPSCARKGPALEPNETPTERALRWPTTAGGDCPRSGDPAVVALAGRTARHSGFTDPRRHQQVVRPAPPRRAHARSVRPRPEADAPVPP